MPGDLDAGARAFYEVSKRLKTAGDGKTLRREFHKSIREAAKPLLRPIRNQAEARFPKKGGLNRHMARGARYRAVTKTGLSTAGVSIRANRTDPRVDTRGRIYHPIPDGRGDWVRYPEGHKRAGQRIMAVQYFPEAVGFFSNTIEERADLVRDDLVQRLERWVLENLAAELHTG